MSVLFSQLHQFIQEVSPLFMFMHKNKNIKNRPGAQAARHLLQLPPLPSVTNLPKPTLPPLPSIPTLPQPTLPSLPTSQPSMPKPTLPPLPSLPKMPASKGRQKLEMVKIQNESNLMVTFSKRRSGLFKKASELCTLCGAEVSIIVFSPGKKVFSFGHPSVEKVMERYVTGNIPQTSGAFHLIEAHRNARIHELNMQLTQLVNQLGVEKKRGEELDRMVKAGQSQNWWENPIQELDWAQLEQLKASLQYLKQDVTRHAKQILIQNSAPPQPFIAANPSSSGNLPFDTRNMSGTPFNTNMTATPFNASTVVPPFGYSLGYGNMMASRKSFILAFFIALAFSSMTISLAARHLLQLPALPPLPSIPNLPQPTLPTLPTTQPSLPKPTLPPLPSIPTIPIPTVPKVTFPPLPSMPSIPTIPTFPSIPFLSPPPATTSP
ncbi:hypothetical protein SADUNF_Sadunf17G0043900 [Salix dunnii]|uniref:MADS-box domain-containing protein n=1 Tax=Salix dunnii TaxID=1413687 RepID=A0A835MJN2_9ROSI|nr:hypothetical protein SADUNF_Sadunf17G0043900 [Salix dunnii]